MKSSIYTLASLILAFAVVLGACSATEPIPVESAASDETAESSSTENGGPSSIPETVEEYSKVLFEDETLRVEVYYHLEIAGSSMETVEYKVTDLAEDRPLTLDELFVGDEYIDVISYYIGTEMRQQMEENPDKVYFIAPEESDGFSEILPGQMFYLTEEHKLVIVFQQYEVAPGYMSTVEFEIPTEILSNLLAGDNYIR